MNIAKLVGPAPDWTGDTWAQRMDAAASVLFVHGYITQSQRLQIAKRMDKQFVDAIASGAIVERAAA